MKNATKIAGSTPPLAATWDLGQVSPSLAIACMT